MPSTRSDASSTRFFFRFSAPDSDSHHPVVVSAASLPSMAQRVPELPARRGRPVSAHFPSLSADAAARRNGPRSLTDRRHHCPRDRPSCRGRDHRQLRLASLLARDILASRLVAHSPASRVRLRVIPGARRPGVVGRCGEAWKVRVAAAPEKGKANLSLTELLARVLDVPRDRLTIVSGHGSRDKLVEVSDLTRTQLEDRLTEASDR